MFFVLLNCLVTLAEGLKTSLVVQYFTPGIPTPVPATYSHVYLKDFTTSVPVENSTFLLTSAEDEGAYSPIIYSSPNHSHILPDHTLLYRASFLCVHQEKEMFRKSPPKEYIVGMTAVIPCTVVGEPLPKISWQLLKDGKFSDLKLSKKVFLSPSQHLVILNTTEQDSGTYRCVATNACGRRCPGESYCRINSTTHGPGVSLTVSRNTTYPYNNTVYCLNYDPYHNRKYSILYGYDQCFSAECIYEELLVKPGNYHDHKLDVVFVGDQQFRMITILPQDSDENILQNLNGICMFDCTNQFELMTDQIQPMSCDVGKFKNPLSCRNRLRHDWSTDVDFIYEIKYISDIPIEPTGNDLVLIGNDNSVNFTTKTYHEIQDVRCYHDNRPIALDFRTTFTNSTHPKGHAWSINKKCPMRVDVGDYYCTLTDTAGGVTVSGHVSVTVNKTNCRVVELLKKTKHSLTVNWPNITSFGYDKYALIAPYPCNDEDESCDSAETRLPLINASLVLVPDLTAGCCYSVQLFLNNGSILAENVAGFQTQKAEPSGITQKEMAYGAYYKNKDKLRITWNVPARNQWGSDSIYYRIDLRKIGIQVNASRQIIETQFNFTVVNELVPVGQPFVYGTMEVCNAAGCSPPHKIQLSVPFRPNMPGIEILDMGCNKIMVNITNKDNRTYPAFRYRVMSYNGTNVTAGIKELFTGNLTEGKNEIKFLKEGDNYNLAIWGINRANQQTLLRMVHFSTHSFCTREIAITCIVVIAVMVVSVLVAVQYGKRCRKKTNNSQYEYATGDDMFAPETGDEISIIHMQGEHATPIKHNATLLTFFQTIRSSLTIRKA